MSDWRTMTTEHLPLRKPKLTPADRDEIGYRRGDGEPVADLAIEYKVTASTIRGCGVKHR